MADVQAALFPAGGQGPRGGAALHPLADLTPDLPGREEEKPLLST